MGFVDVKLRRLQARLSGEDGFVFNGRRVLVARANHGCSGGEQCFVVVNSSEILGMMAIMVTNVW